MNAIGVIEGPQGAAAHWSTIVWSRIRRHVSRLQARIVKAVRSPSHTPLIAGCFTAPYQGLSRVR
jgi:hypothetical protein